jgi:hypothetical protein
MRPAQHSRHGHDPQRAVSRPSEASCHTTHSRLPELPGSPRTAPERSRRSSPHASQPPVTDRRSASPGDASCISVPDTSPLAWSSRPEPRQSLHCLASTAPIIVIPRFRESLPTPNRPEGVIPPQRGGNRESPQFHALGNHLESLGITSIFDQPTGP